MWLVLQVNSHVSFPFGSATISVYYNTFISSTSSQCQNHVLAVQLRQFLMFGSSTCQHRVQSSLTFITGWTLLFESEALHYTHAQTLITLPFVINKAEHALANITIKHKYILVCKYARSAFVKQYCCRAPCSNTTCNKSTVL